MALFQPNPNPSGTELRWFAGVWFPALGAFVGLLVFRRAPPVGVAVWALTAIQAIAGLLVPAAIQPIYRGALRLTFPIGWVMSHAIVAASYFLVITPIGRLMRLWHDPMRRSIDPAATTYWIDCEKVDRDRYFRQM